MVLPRRVTRRIRVSRFFYLTTWRIWSFVGRRLPQGKRREGYLSVFGPLSLLFLFATWAFGLVFGYGLLYWSIRSPMRTDVPMNFWMDLYMSGSTFFTLGLGDVTPVAPLARAIVVSECGLGLAFLALVLSYLPILYQAFSRRESVIALLDARAGSPATATELLRRHYQGGASLESLEQTLREWERWAAELLESHVSFPVLAFFRSQHDNQSWLSSITAILDTCTLVIHGVGGPVGWQAQLTFAMARHAIVDLAQVLGSPPKAPKPERQSVQEFERIRSTLQKAGMTLNHDPELAAKVADLRAMYEPFVNSMADFLILRLPPWTHGGRVDNWRTSAWGRISAKSKVLPLADLGDDDHL